MSLVSYFAHLMKLYDPRFRMHPTFKFFALNSIYRWRSIASGNLYVKNTNVSGIRELLEDEEVLNRETMKVLRYAKTLRGTRTFWQQEKFKLLDMINSFEVLPTLFFTLSAVHKHLQDDQSVPKCCLPVPCFKHRSEALLSDPVIADVCFYNRIEVFLKYVKRILDVDRHWLR